jgi:ribose transport system substrate-binding protein
MSKRKCSKRSILAIMTLLLVIVLAACAGAAEETPTQPPAVQDTPMAEETPVGDGFTIGVSNGFVASEWRTQMISDMEEVAGELGVTLDIESADVDVQGQIQQIQNLINRDVDAIIINPNSQDGLNSVIADAAAEGILVIAIDQEVSAPEAINVVIDQQVWGRVNAEWLAQQLNGEGDIVVIEGFVGHPANEARVAGLMEVMVANPGLEVIGRDTGSWDQATGQQVMSDFLASLGAIDGLWTQDGMAEGALRAVRTANPDQWPEMVGEARTGYIKLWNETKQEREFTSVGVVNPPGVGASGIRVAYEILQGGQVDESQFAGPFSNSLYVPIPFVVTDTDFQPEGIDVRGLEEVFNEVQDRPDSYVLDGIITQEEAASFMQ